MGIDGPDALLRQFAESCQPAQTEALLETLVVNHAQPAIRKIIRRKLAYQGTWEAQDVEDLTSEVLIELIGRLRAMKEQNAATAIGSFSGYTAVAAYHACHEYLRRKHPNRHRLKNQLRYLLNTEKRFAIWETGDGEWACGFARWQSESRPPVPQEVIERWRDHLPDLPHGRAGHPADLLTRIFDRLGGPMEFDELVRIVGTLWGVDDPVPAPESAARDLQSAESGPAELLELRDWMKNLWQQICQLPEGQRAALLLNLRCGSGASAAALIPLTGVASLREIAGVLGISAGEFAELWNRLPLDDAAIAGRLGVTRQKVINWRKSARERLLRRMGSNMGPKSPSIQL